MYFLVTLGTLGNVSMPVMMALRTKYFGMFTRCFLPLGIDFRMAGATGICRFGREIRYLLRLMYRMALSTGGEFLPLEMRFMASKT